MAYSYNNDERFGSRIIERGAGSRDASSSTDTAFWLAPNTTGYGALVSPIWYQVDVDVYDLGILDAGTYLLDVNGYKWDSSNSIYGTAGLTEFGVFDSSGVANYGHNSFTEFNDVEFTLDTKTQMYAYIRGSFITPQVGTEYSIQYRKISEPNFGLNDPVGFDEYLGTASNDTFYLSSNTVYFGGQGNDTIYSGYNGQNQIAIGGDGNDTYKISSPGFLTIADLSNSTYDVVEATGIGVYRPNTYFATVDGGRHLYIVDLDSSQAIIALDYQDPENKIEVIRASDATLTYDELIYALNNSPNSFGDLSWADVALLSGTTLTGSQINSSIDFYKTAHALLNNTAPNITTSPITTINQGDSFYYQIGIYDPDISDLLTVSAGSPTGNLPDWLYYNADQQYLYGTLEMKMLVTTRLR